MKKLISVITPCYNEEANVQECYQRLRKVFETDLSNYAYEHIFADNASTDCTLLELRKLAAIDKNVKVIVNSRNVGPFRNMWNAMKHASGDAIIPLLPADLQDPPEVIPALVKNWEIGDLVVYGIRKNRQEGVMMRLLRSIYYRIIAKFADVEIPKDSGEFLLADSRVIHSVINLDDSYPYIRGLIAKTAVRHSFVSYTWEKRKFGKSRNSWVDLIDQALNGFVSTSRVPARLAILLGFALSFVGIFQAGFSLISTLLNRGDVSSGIPTIIVAIFCFSGFQLLFLGIIGEYVLSIHSQVRRGPEMFEIEKLNL